MAYSSATALVNSSLIKIGENRITTLASDSSRQGVAAREQYPIALDILLRMARWRFATARAALALDATSPAFGFAYQHVLPTDFIAFIGVWEDGEDPRNYTSSTIAHKIEAAEGSDATVILSDESEMNIFYVKRVTNTLLWDPLFGDALSWYLAGVLGYYLTSGRDYITLADSKFKDAMKIAKTMNAFEGSTEVLTASEWLDSRNAGAQNLNFASRSGWTA